MLPHVSPDRVADPVTMWSLAVWSHTTCSSHVSPRTSGLDTALVTCLRHVPRHSSHLILTPVSSSASLAAHSVQLSPSLIFPLGYPQFGLLPAN